MTVILADTFAGPPGALDGSGLQVPVGGTWSLLTGTSGTYKRTGDGAIHLDQLNFDGVIFAAEQHIDGLSVLTLEFDCLPGSAYEKTQYTYGAPKLSFTFNATDYTGKLIGALTNIEINRKIARPSSNALYNVFLNHGQLTHIKMRMSLNPTPLLEVYQDNSLVYSNYDANYLNAVANSANNFGAPADGFALSILVENNSSWVNYDGGTYVPTRISNLIMSAALANVEVPLPPKFWTGFSLATETGAAADAPPSIYGSIQSVLASLTAALRSDNDAPSGGSSGIGDSRADSIVLQDDVLVSLPEHPPGATWFSHADVAGEFYSFYVFGPNGLDRRYPSAQFLADGTFVGNAAHLAYLATESAIRYFPVTPGGFGDSTGPWDAPLYDSTDTGIPPGDRHVMYARSTMAAAHVQAKSISALPFTEASNYDCPYTWYSFTASAGVKYKITSRDYGSVDNTDTFIGVFDANGSPLGSSDDYSGDDYRSELEITPVAGGTIYVCLVAGWGFVPEAGWIMRMKTPEVDGGFGGMYALLSEGGEFGISISAE